MNTKQRQLRLPDMLQHMNLSGEAHQALKDAVQPEGRVKLGALLAEIGREARGFDLQIERDKTISEPMSFE